MLKKSFLILCFILYVGHSSSTKEPAPLPAPIRIGIKLWKVVDALNNANTAWDFATKLGTIIIAKTDEHKEIMDQFSKLSEQTTNFQNYVEDQFKIITDLIKELPTAIPNEMDLRKLYWHFEIINTTYTGLYSHIRQNPDESVWVQFVKDAPNVENEMLAIRYLVAPQNGHSSSAPAGNLQNIAKKGSQLGRELCGAGQSIAQLLKLLVDRVLLAEVQTLTILSMTARFKLPLPKARQQKIILYKGSFEGRYLDYLQAGINAMKAAPQSFRACDPDSWVQGKSYFELGLDALSLDLVQSNVAENKVITGVRFVKRDNVLFIQIREGELMADGLINSANSGWVPLPENPQKMFYEGRQRLLVLSNVTVPSGYALVGLQFVVPNDTDRQPEATIPYVWRNPGISLTVIGQKFDFSKGKILPGRTEVSTQLVPEYKKFHPKRKPSTKAPKGKFMPVEDSLIYVKLDYATEENDKAETVLPLFDGMEVVSNPPTALGGIGTFLKTIGGYEGFISLRLHSLPYSHYLEEQMWSYKQGRVFDDCTEASCSFDHILDIGEKVHHFMKMMTEVYEVGDDTDTKLARIFPDKDAKPPATMEFIDIKERLKSSNYYMTDENMRSMWNSLVALNLDEPTSNALNLFMEYTSSIDERYKKLVRYSEGNHAAKNETFDLSNNERILGDINKLHQLLLHTFENSTSGGILQEISRQSKLFAENGCMNAISIPEIFAQMLRLTIATEVKAMMLITFSSRVHDMMLALRTEENIKDYRWSGIYSTIGMANQSAWKETVFEQQRKFTERFLTYVHGFQDAIHNSPEDIRTCHAPTKATQLQFVPEYDILSETPTSISLAAFNASVSDNMVISALKFVIRDGVLFLQPEQTKLAPNGMLDPESSRWLPLPNDPEKVDIDVKHRKLFFGDVNFLPEYAIVGLQFAQKDDGFILKVTARRFDFSTGKLLPDELTLSTDHEWREGINSLQLHELHPHLPHDYASDRESIELELASSLRNKKPSTAFGARALFPIVQTPLGGIGYFHRSFNSTTGLVFLRALAPRYEDNLLNFIEKSKRGHIFVDY